jgi:hypothetical protein
MKATVTATLDQTRILVEDNSGDRLLARLPALTSCTHARALPTLLESLALWSGAPLHVVLCVDEMFDWQRSGLVDALDIATDTLFYRVEVVPLQHGPKLRAKRLSRLGSFARERAVRRSMG